MERTTAKAKVGTDENTCEALGPLAYTVREGLKMTKAKWIEGVWRVREAVGGKDSKAEFKCCQDDRQYCRNRLWFGPWVIVSPDGVCEPFKWDGHYASTKVG